MLGLWQGVQLRDVLHTAEETLAILCIGLWQRVQLLDAPHRVEEPLGLLC